jgi:hypothetical protein
MRKSRFTEAQIVSILKELDAGRPAVELARKARRPSQYVALMAQQVRRFGNERSRAPQRTRSRKRPDGTDHRTPGARDSCYVGAYSKKRVGPSARREAVRALQSEGLSERQACILVSCPRETTRYEPRRSDDTHIRDRSARPRAEAAAVWLAPAEHSTQA